MKGSFLRDYGLSLSTVAMAFLWLGADASGQEAEQRLKSFGFGATSGASCRARLVQGEDGAWYGTTTAGGSNNLGTVFRVTRTSTGIPYEGYAVLHHFGAGDDGQQPVAGLVQGRDGGLYGTTAAGGAHGWGTVFKLNTHGADYRVVYSFGAFQGDGQSPGGELAAGQDGAFYGTTSAGGSAGWGTVFRLNADGTSYEQIHWFGGGSRDGQNPFGALIQGRDGAFYGTTAAGGSSGYGTIFKIIPGDASFSLIYSLGASTEEGRNPNGGLIQDPSGILYGTTCAGGTNGAGTVFALSTNGSGFIVLHHFATNGIDGQNPRYAALTQSKVGALYGTTSKGGSNHLGTVFRLSPDGSGYAILHCFGAGADGQTPLAGLTCGSQGEFYGTTFEGGTAGKGVVFRLSGVDAGAAGYSVVFNLGADGGDAVGPFYATLCVGRDGFLYGMTSRGGASGAGAAYRLSLDGSGYALLHSFEPNDGHALGPNGGLIQASDSALYGTTLAGGTNSQGSVFKLTADGSVYTVLHHFAPDGGDGAWPYASLMQGRDAALYGVTYLGGAYHSGTIFRLNLDGSNYAVIHSFGGPGDAGAQPFLSPLIQGSDGALYGAAWIIYRINPDGSDYSAIHQFTPTDLGQWGNGVSPVGGLLECRDGALYGTTEGGGNYGAGTVFRLNRDGSGFALLHSFNPTAQDGAGPCTTLIQGPGGALYGTTPHGGAEGVGTVYRLNPDGSGYLVLRSFSCSGGDGQAPGVGVVRGPDGALYGTTCAGGDLGLGTVFRLSGPLSSPFAFTALTRLSDGSTRLSYGALAGLTWRIEAAGNFGDWEPLITLTNPSVPFHLVDSQAGRYSRRFYRAVWVP